MDWIQRETPTVFGVARAIVEGSGGDPDARVRWEGPAPVWTDHVNEAKLAIRRTAMMLRATGFEDAAVFLDKEAA